MKTKNDKEVKEVVVLYSGEVSYIGEVNSAEIAGDNFNWVTIYRPFVLNVRPITKEDKRIEVVVLDMLLPIEFGGIAINEQLYTGFVGFSESAIELPGQSVVTTPDGRRLSVTKMKTLVNRGDPCMRISGINRILKPSQELEYLYISKVANYNDLLFGTRLVDLQSIQEDETAETDPINSIGNTIDLDKNSLN
jgi:hypothetical protein